MSAKKHIIALNEQEREQLEKMARSNRRSIREKTRARILLFTDTNRSREDGGCCKDSEVASRARFMRLLNACSKMVVRRRRATWLHLLRCKA